jgi:hypothetical protein
MGPESKARAAKGGATDIFDQAMTSTYLLLAG